MSDHGSGRIGLGTAVIIGLNAMIGAGIISIPSLLAVETGPAGILTFIFSVCVVLLIGLSLGDIAQKLPGEGWNYRYPAYWGGHFLGLFSSFAYLAGVIVAMGFLVQQAGVYFHTAFPSIAAEHLSVAVLALLTSLVLAGAQMSSWGQYAIIFCVAAPLLVTTLVCLGYFNIDYLSPFMPYGPMSLLRAGPTALFGFMGFESVVSLYAIVQNPSKNVPRACIISVFLVGTFYILFLMSVIGAIAPEYFVGGLDNTLSNIIVQGLPQHAFLSNFVFISALAAIVGTLHSMIWSVGVLLTGVLERVKCGPISKLVKSGAWNDRVSVLCVSTLMLMITLGVEGKSILAMTPFFVVPSYSLSIIALFFVKEKLSGLALVRTLLALLGGVMMIYFSAQPVVDIVRGLIG
jgi:APA family basic amino acid/polyamine antiporter